MTDRIHSITIVLSDDIRDDDAEALLTACRSFRGVIAVTPNVSDFSVHTAEQRARHYLGGQLLDIIYPNRREP